MGAYGRRRVETQLEWSHQAPRLLAAYKALWHGSAREAPAGAVAEPACEGGGTRFDGPESPR